jgi:hypothetical protein
VRAGANTGPALEVLWDAATDNGPANLIRYEIKLRRDGTTVGTPVTVDTLSKNFTGLRSDTDYVFEITTIDGRNNRSGTVQVTLHTTWKPDGDDDNDGVTNQTERDLGLDWGNASDVRVFKYTYDKANQLKVGPGGEYLKDAEGNIKKLQP